jgi:hypothetical protein
VSRAFPWGTPGFFGSSNKISAVPGESRGGAWQVVAQLGKYLPDESLSERGCQMQGNGVERETGFSLRAVYTVKKMLKISSGG